MILTFLILVALVGVNAASGECDSTQYTKVGCFNHNKRIFPDLLANNRDSSTESYIGEKIDWQNYKSSLEKLTCACLQKVQEQGYEVFALGFYGECWAGKSMDAMSVFATDQASISNNCIAHHYGECNNADEESCVGGANALYVYSLPSKAPAPINAGYSEWSEFSSCSKTCGDGFQERERACNNPLPQNGGEDCSNLGEVTETKSCKIVDCPVDGVLSEWSEYEPCNNECGGGSQSRSRTCTPPKYGGSPCSGSLTESKQCNTQNCPVDGKWSFWSGWSTCSKTCGGGSSYKNRTCEGPFHGGKACSGSNRETKKCGTEKCLVKSHVEGTIKDMLKSSQSQSHSTFANTLKNSLASTYPSYYFTVSVYNDCSGWDNHGITGYSYQHVWRQYERNVAVTYAKKTSNFPSSTERNKIKNAVLDAIVKKGRSAKTSMDLAWNKATSFGYPIASVHVVRFGNGLRSVSSGYWNFENFVCDRSCNLLGVWCTNHESSVVITYGSA